MKPIVNLLLVAGLGLFTAAAASAQTSRGNIKAVRVQGDVNMALASGGPTIKLVEGAVLRDRTLVTTGTGGRTVLLFSNGSAAWLRPNTQLAIDQFKQDPFKGDVRTMATEPSTSKVNMTLKRGSLVSNVKKLRTGSEYLVRNPLGAAGVRGTKTEYNYVQNGNTGQSTTTTISGSNVWQGSFPGSSPTPVEEEEQLIATGEFDSNGNLITYQQQLVTPDQGNLQQLQQEGQLLEQIQEEEEPPPPPAEEEEEETDGGPNNPTNFTSPP